MPVCVDITSEGFLQQINVDTCEAYILVTASEYTDLNTHQSVSAADASLAIGFGFSIVFGLGYLTTYGFGVGQRLIKKA
ncbi:single-stranded DNA-binding protein [Vibrionales bacterium C3R12]|nr:single-stranded DNA-binding protein [Vibrionales bacterium C3R12]